MLNTEDDRRGYEESIDIRVKRRRDDQEDDANTYKWNSTGWNSEGRPKRKHRTKGNRRVSQPNPAFKMRGLQTFKLKMTHSDVDAMGPINEKESCHSQVEEYGIEEKKSSEVPPSQPTSRAQASINQDFFKEQHQHSDSEENKEEEGFDNEAQLI